MTPALQLYSMRDCADQIALLAQLPAMGIARVEGYGGVYSDPAAYRSAMDANGISMPSGHMGLDDIEADFDTTMGIIETLGITHVFAPYLEEKDRPDTVSGWAALGQRRKATQAGHARLYPEANETPDYRSFRHQLSQQAFVTVLLTDEGYFALIAPQRMKMVRGIRPGSIEIGMDHNDTGHTFISEG